MSTHVTCMFTCAHTLHACLHVYTCMSLIMSFLKEAISEFVLINYFSAKALIIESKLLDMKINSHQLMISAAITHFINRIVIYLL